MMINNRSVTCKRQKRSPLTAGRVLVTFLLCVLVFLGFLAYFSARWYVLTYGKLGFDSILYTLLADLSGLDADLVLAYTKYALIPALLLSAAAIFVLFFAAKKKLMLILFKKVRVRIFPLKRSFAILLSVVLSLGLIAFAAYDVELFPYLRHITQMTTLYQDEFRDPASTGISFPEQKRNLIYIFLESMETTYFSKEQGGALNNCITPELFQLAEENVNFSQNDSVGGFFATSGTTWTIGAMVGHSSGLPLKLPPGLGGNDYGQDETFLPGATTLSDVLHDNGYYQALMVGSDASFGGRKQYYSSHGIDKIYDLYTAREDGIVPPDYHVWWGMEDVYLFQYAKQELLKASANDQPFAFSLLTVDTHFPGGYICSACPDTYSNQYENAIACSSKQVLEFVQWLQQQDFYENTTIVLAGDHPTMDGEYITSIAAKDDARRMYNCIINPASQPVREKNREFSTLDLFPTTLGALGCVIDGDRLGLGTNLFSETPTLAEQMGAEAFRLEVSKASNYYTSHFFFEN